MAQHSSSEALVIPRGAQFEASPQGFNVSNPGDIRLDGTPALPLHRLSSAQGNVHLVSETALNLDRIEAPRGEIHLSGPITVHSLLGRRVVFEKGSLSVRSMVAEEEIVIAGEQLQADMIVAPQVTLQERTRGRATVIESKNELGATSLKGCFRLEDYLEVFPNGQAQVDQYPDVKARLATWSKAGAPARPAAPVAPAAPAPAASAPAPAAPRPAPAPQPAPAPAPQAARPAAPVIPVAPAAPSTPPASAGGMINLASAAPARAPEPVRPVSLLGGNDEVMVLTASDRAEDQPEVLTQPIGLRDERYERGLDDLLMTEAEAEPVVEIADDSEEEALYQRLSDRFHKALSCYSDTDVPPQITRLEKLIEDRQFDTLRKELVPLYHDLLRYHKTKKQHIANAVTSSIQDIKRILSDEQ